MGRLILIIIILSSIKSNIGYANGASHFLHLSDSFISINLDSSRYYLELYKQSQDRINSKKQLSDYYFTQAKIEFNANNLKQASYLFQKLLKKYKTQGDLKKVAETHSYIAKTNFKLNNYKISIKNALEAKTLFDSLQMKRPSMICSNLIGAVFFHINQFYLAKEYFLEVEKHALKQNDEELLLSAYNNLANIYILDTLLQREKATVYLNKAIVISKKLSSSNLATLYLNLSNIFIQSNKLDSAEHYLNEALKLTQTNEPYLLSKIYFCYGEISEERKNFEQSKKWFRKSINMANINHDLNSLKESYKHISNIQFKNGNYQEAYKNLEKSSAYNDTIINNEHLNTINNLISKHNKENNSHKVEVQNSKIIAQEIKIRNQKYKNIGLIILLSIVTIIGFVIIFYSKRLRFINKSYKESLDVINEKNRQLEKTVKTRDKLISTIAHDIKNPLGAITGFAELALKSNDKSSTKLYNKQIYNSSIKIYNLLNDLVAWGKAQKELITASPERLNISELVNNNFKIFQELANENNIKLINVCSMKHFINADKYTLSSALRNLINNAIKFTNKDGEIIIRSEQYENKTFIHISDNGIGINKADIPKLFDQSSSKDTIGDHHNKGTGIGLVLSNEFIKLNNGTISVRSKKDHGSCFTICLPASQTA